MPENRPGRGDGEMNREIEILVNGTIFRDFDDKLRPVGANVTTFDFLREYHAALFDQRIANDVLKTKVAALEAENAEFRGVLTEYRDAEWQVSHDWGGDRKSILDKCDVLLAEYDAKKGRNDEEHTCKTCCWDDPPEYSTTDELNSWIMECPPCDKPDHDDVSGCEEHWEKKSSLYGFAE